MSPHCDIDLKDRKLIFSDDTLAHDDALQYQVWLQKVQQSRRYGQGEISVKFLTFTVTVTLSTTQQNNIFHKTTKIMMMCHQTKDWLEKDQ